MSITERAAVWLWNRVVELRERRFEPGVNIGVALRDDGSATRELVSVAERVRAQHIVVLGRTGMGKSSLLRYMMGQDIRRGNGFAVFDLHGDLTPFVLRAVAAEERRLGRQLTNRLIVVDPSDPDFSAGIRLLSASAAERYREVADITAILRRRFQLDAFGARTEELLRNGLLVLAANELTVVELPLLLTDERFRAVCLKNEPSAEVRHFFNARFTPLSEPYKAIIREPVLNKVSAFTVDPRFRHLVGQTTPEIDLLSVMEQGKILVIDLDRARFGEQAVTLGSLVLATMRNSLYRRKRRKLFTLYCDELQNLVGFGSEIEVLFAEARKFGVGICAANQYLDQYPKEIRSAVLSAVTQVYFRLSASDADRIATSLGPVRRFAESLRELPEREVIVNSGAMRAIHARVPLVHTPRIDPALLYDRVRHRWLKPRATIEYEIRKRQRGVAERDQSALEDWQ